MSDFPGQVRALIAATDTKKFSAKVKTVADIEKLGGAFAQSARIRVLRNYTLESLEPLIRFGGYRNGIETSASFSDFDTFEQEVRDTNSETNVGKYDLILLTLWLDGLLPAGGSYPNSLDGVYERVAALVERLRENTSALVAVTTFLPPSFALGSARREKGSLGVALDQVNARLAELAVAKDRIYVINSASLVEKNGEAQSLDSRFWYLYRAPFKNDYLSALASELVALVTSQKGGTKKVLALDCDNTLWGGIIGEDGIEGIALDPQKYPGAAFYDFQRQCLELKRQGTLLALCSKNNEPDVDAVLAQHPHCLLKKDDFAAVFVNWQNKAQNLIDLAGVLNLGLDSLVFVDDNPVECGLVQQQVPEVTVLQVPANPYDLTRLLREFRGFDKLTVSQEDLGRSKMYREEAERTRERERHADLDAYLKSLALEVELREPRAEEIPRTAQLTQKTNQFNLTTRRYSHGEIEERLNSDRYRVVVMTVKDKFGDYGLTGVGIVERCGDEASIEALLMSCRVLGRKVENAFVKQLLEKASSWPGVTRVQGTYLPSAKNQQVADFYDRLGFRGMKKSTEMGEKRYEFDLESQAIDVPEYISVVHGAGVKSAEARN